MTRLERPSEGQPVKGGTKERGWQPREKEDGQKRGGKEGGKNKRQKEEKRPQGPCALKQNCLAFQQGYSQKTVQK